MLCSSCLKDLLWVFIGRIRCPFSITYHKSSSKKLLSYRSRSQLAFLRNLSDQETSFIKDVKGKEAGLLAGFVCLKEEVADNEYLSIETDEFF